MATAPRTIATYTHDAPVPPVQPDTQPGLYYVTVQRTVRDGVKTGWLAGPLDSHAAVLALVEQVRDLAYQADPATHWDQFGTARLRLDNPNAPVGVLNAALGLSA